MIHNVQIDRIVGTIPRRAPHGPGHSTVCDKDANSGPALAGAARNKTIETESIRSGP